MQRVIEWLSQATLPAQRQKRLGTLKTLLRRSSRLMQSYLAPLVEEPGARRAQAENMVRTLQSSAARHGELLEGLLPPLKAFETLLAVQQPREEQVNGLFTDTIDLFAENAQESAGLFQTKDKARLAHKVWINHLRQWSRNEAAPPALGWSLRCYSKLRMCWWSPATGLICLSSFSVLSKRIKAAPRNCMP
jgi:hypothetical protein